MLAACDGGRGRDDASANDASSSDGASSCVQSTPNVVAEFPPRFESVTEVSAAMGSLFALDRGGGNETGAPLFERSGEIARVALPSAMPERLYAPTAGSWAQIRSVMAAPNGDVLFLQMSLRSPENTSLMRLRGGAATEITTLAGTSARLFAVDDQSAFVVGPVMGDRNTIVRVTLATGTATTIVSQPGTSFANVQLAGNFVWYSTEQGNGPLFKTPRDAMDSASQTMVSARMCTSVRVIDNGFLCGALTSLLRLDGNFTGETTLYRGAGRVLVLAVNDRDVIVRDIRSPTRSSLVAVSLANGAARTLACDLDTEVWSAAIVGDDVVWVVATMGTGGTGARIMRVAIPR